MQPRQKVHDINEILSEAKNKRAFIEEAREKQKYMEFTKGRNSKYDKRYDEMENEEKELEELINTMAMPKINNETKEALDMFSDLKGSDDTIVTNPIESSFEVTKTKEASTFENKDKEETSTDDLRGDLNKTLVKADRNFYTDSNMFTKNDFEDFSTLTKELKRSNKTKKIVITLIILIILGVLAYFGVTKFLNK